MSDYERIAKILDDKYNELETLKAENARLRAALHHIGFQSAQMSSVDFSWRSEWENLRNEARAALKSSE